MNKKLNKKLLNLIALCSGITATVAIGIGGIVYSIQENIHQIPLPYEVYEIDENNTLLGFKDEFLNDPTSPIYKNNFKDCNTMQIPASVTSVNAQAFYGGGSYGPTIPDYIKNLIFAENSNCSSITTMAFEMCSSLTSIDLSKCINLSLIDAYTFHGCLALTSLSFPTGLAEIGEYAFSSCLTLTSVTFPSSLESIIDCAFDSCKSLTSVSFSNNLQSIGEAFSNCPNLSSITWDAWKGNICWNSTSFSGVCQNGGTITVTNVVDGYDSDELLHFLLNNGGLPSTWAKDVNPILPEDVYKIDENNVLRGFKDEFLNDSASPIYKDNFQDCNTMLIPTNVTSINFDAFYNAPSTTIPTFITNLIFDQGSSCSSIGESAFANCSSLISVSFSNNLQSIGQKTFQFCRSLSSVVLPNNLTTLEKYVFYTCSSLTSVSLPSNLQLIDQHTFENCSSLTSISFPKNLEKIEYEAFSGCPNLSSITWDAWNGNAALQISSFMHVCQTGGTVTVTNQIDSEHDSAALLAYLKANCGLPDNWRVAEE